MIFRFPILEIGLSIYFESKDDVNELIILIDIIYGL